MAFRFEYVGLNSRPSGCGHWVGAGDQQWNLLGQLTEGRIALGDAILLFTRSGVVFQGYVARFAESFSEWVGLPFYNYLTPEMMPHVFCLCVGGAPGDYEILCPAVAVSMPSENNANLALTTMAKKENQTACTASVQIFELTMDNPEDQDELNRQLHKPGESNNRPSGKNGCTE